MLRIRRREVSEDQLNQLIDNFEQFKAEWDDAIIRDDSIFVRTPAFETLAQHRESRTNTILLGRKGDGKTAILRRLQHETRKPATGMRREYFTWINMEDAYFSELVSKFDQICTGITAKNSSIPESHIASRLWLKFLKLTALQVFIRHCDENPAISQQIRDSHEMDVGSLRRMVSDELGVQEMFFRQSDIGPNFVSFLQRVLGLVLQSDRYVARQIDESKPFLINAHDTLRDIGPQLQEWARVIEATGLQFTIALDRFDDFIDNLVSDDLPRTRKIRRFFLQGLVPTLSKLDNDKSFAWLRVVASLPEDLVVDIALREIASHKKLHFVEIDWSRGNLVSLLDGRVSSVLPGITFSEIFSYQVPNLNHLVLTKETPEDYLIRHTTRRPREVMAHAARLFTFMRKQRRVPSPREYGEIIHLSNKEIVEDQVFPEWQSVLPSIRSFFSGMARRSPPTVFTLAEFEQWDQASSSVGLHRYGENMLSGEAKSFTALAALFRVGSVGFRVRRASRRDGYIRQGDNDFVRYIFAFTSKRDPISDIVDFLLRPNLPELVETSEGKSYRGTLLGQDHGIYDIALCFSPMFFEVAGAEHMSPYLVGEHLEESVY